MTCPFEREQIALFVNDDLEPDQHEAVAAHLAACDACRLQAAAFGADALAIAGATAAVGASPRLARRPRHSGRAWLPAAVAAVVLLLMAGATQVEAIEKRLIVLFPFLQVEEMSHEEYQALMDKAATGQIITPVDFATVEAASRAVGYPVARFGMVPAGYALKRVWVSFPDQPQNSEVGQMYNTAADDAVLALSQTHAGQITGLAEEGTTRELMMKGGKAALVERQWSGDDGVRISRSLFFQWHGQAMVMTSSATKVGGPVLTAEELVKLAESLQ